MFWAFIISMILTCVLGVATGIVNIESISKRRIITLIIIISATINCFIGVESFFDSQKAYKSLSDSSKLVLDANRELILMTEAQDDTIAVLKDRLIRNQMSLQDKSDLVIKTQGHLLNLSSSTLNEITGGNSYCYLDPSVFTKLDKYSGEIINKVYFTLKIHGEFPLRNIHFAVCDLLGHYKGKNNDNCFYGSKEMQIGNKHLPPNISTSQYEFILIGDISDLIFRIEIEASGKNFNQYVRLKRINEFDWFDWIEAFDVSSLTYDKADDGITYIKQVQLYEKAHDKFPRNKDGSFDRGKEVIISHRQSFGKDTDSILESMKQSEQKN